MAIIIIDDHILGLSWCFDIECQLWRWWLIDWWSLFYDHHHVWLCNWLLWWYNHWAASNKLYIFMWYPLYRLYFSYISTLTQKKVCPIPDHYWSWPYFEIESFKYIIALTQFGKKSNKKIVRDNRYLNRCHRSIGTTFWTKVNKQIPNQS